MSVVLRAAFAHATLPSHVLPLLRPAPARQMSAATKQIAEAAARVVYHKPVPSDIDVSQSVPPLHISKIAADAGGWAWCGCM
jgi:hypothetical protein